MHVIPFAGSDPQSKGKDPVRYVRKRQKKSAAESCGSTPRSQKVLLPVNPLQPIYSSWDTLKPELYEDARMNFNPYEFGQRTCNDPRFYCKMHQQVYTFKICKLHNSHVKQHIFDEEAARQKWPEVMDLIDFHGITPLMSCSRPFSPTLLREFFATVYFTEGDHASRSMQWMSGGVQCSATLKEFGALIGVEIAEYSYYSHVRIHGEEKFLMSAKEGIKHCYPSNSGTKMIPKVRYFTDFWYVTHTILRHTIHVKFGEKGMARGWMVNLLNKIVTAKEKGKPLDVLDYMWNELKLTDRKSTRLNSSHRSLSRMPSSA